MLKQITILGLVSLAFAVSACKTAPEPKRELAAVEVSTEEREVYTSPHFDMSPDIVDLSAQGEKQIAPYTIGSEAMHLSDVLPVLSSSGGYNQKWEFFIYSKPYTARIKFEISNFAFSKNEAKIRGYVKEVDADGNTINEYKISEKYKSDAWSASKTALNLNFGGEYTLALKNGVFVIHGKFEKGTFDFEVEPNLWKPGTGAAYFGNDPENAFKYSVLTYHKPLRKGIIHLDTGDVEVTGPTYGNHYMTNLAVYDMFDELADFRKLTDDLLVEFRYFVPSQKFEGSPFGYLFVAYDGVPVLGSSKISRQSVEKWLDDANYNYEIDARQDIYAQDEDNTGVFRILKAKPEGVDPYADLPGFQRSVAMRFAKPIEYSIKIDWALDLNVDGYKAHIPMSGSYSLTKMR